MKKPTFSTVQLTNDPSLRWCPYRYGEVVYSDSHEKELRFLGYADNANVRLGTINGIAEIAGHVNELTVRRPTVMKSYNKSI